MIYGEELEIEINKLSREIYKQNKEIGWWDNARSEESVLMLVVTEIAEATEGERKDLMDNHLPYRKMGEVELADALIRVLDYGGKECLNYSVGHLLDNPNDVTKEDIDVNGVIGEHFYLVQFVVMFNLYPSDRVTRTIYYSALISEIIVLSIKLGYDIMSAMKEKIEYNKTREDHKRENRAKKHGKKA